MYAWHTAYTNLLSGTYRLLSIVPAILLPPPSGETANGAFPDQAVGTMAAITANAEVGINYYQVCVVGRRGGGRGGGGHRPWPWNYPPATCLSPPHLYDATSKPLNPTPLNQ